MLCVDKTLELHQTTVAQWHQEPISNNYEGVWQLICAQHAYNFRLWHEEDIARSRDVSDTKIAQVKRNIDGFNQNRNDWIEKIDDWITGWLLAERLEVLPETPINSETPGSIIDRLSIMSLRIYHLREQLHRNDVDDSHHQAVQSKIAVCLEQQADLAGALRQLLEDLQAGRKRHKTYRQFKMYNDPTLNPYLYTKPLKNAG